MALKHLLQVWIDKGQPASQRTKSIYIDIPNAVNICELSSAEKAHHNARKETLCFSANAKGRRYKPEKKSFVGQTPGCTCNRSCILGEWGHCGGDSRLYGVQPHHSSHSKLVRASAMAHTCRIPSAPRLLQSHQGPGSSRCPFSQSPELGLILCRSGATCVRVCVFHSKNYWCSGSR